MKKLISIFLSIITMFVFLGTNIQGVLAAGDVFNIPDEVSGNTLNITINAPSKMFKSVLYIDGVKVCDFSEIASGRSVTHSADISDIAAGRHIALFLANSTKGIISEEKTFTITKSGAPTFTDVAFISGSSEVSENNWEYGKPKPARDGYKFTLSGAFSGDVNLYYFENGKKNLLDADIIKVNNEYTIKTKRTPFENTMYIAQFGNELQYAFKTTASEEVTVYKNLDFEKDLGLSVSGVNATQGRLIDKRTVDGNGVFHAWIQNSTSGCYADVNVGTIVNVEKYVVDFKINISKIDGSSKIGILDGKDIDSKWRCGFYIDSSLSISQSESSSYKNFYTFPKDTWIRVIVAYDVASGKYNFEAYDEDTLVYSKNGVDIVGALRPNFFRIDAYPGGNLEFMIDDFKIYSGSEKKDDFQNSSIMGGAADAEKIIGTASVFTVDSDNYYFANEKHKYSSNEEKPVEIDGVPYVSGEFISNVLLACDKTFDDRIKIGNTIFVLGSNGVIKIDDKLYLKAENAALALGKKYTYDDRGYFIFSDGAFSAINSNDITSIFDLSDSLHRYVMMENPRGEEVLTDFKNSDLYGVHPRILYTYDEIEWLKNLAENGDSEVILEIDKAEKRGENHLNWSKLTVNDSNSVKQYRAASAQNAVTYLAEAYLLTGDTRFAQSGVKILDAAAGWKNLAWSTSNLTTGHWAALMAIGYDSFYNYLNATSSGRTKLQTYRDAMENMAFADTILAYSGGNGPHWVTIADNFSGVIGGGMLALCMAVADEEQFKDQMPYLLENIIKTNELSAVLYYNDGAYFEGTTYSEYMLENLSIGLEALFKACGGDYGISCARGFDNAGDMFAYLNTPSQTFDFSDSEPQPTNSHVPLWFGYRYGKTGAAELNMKRMREDGYDNEFLRAVFFYKKMIDKYGDTDVFEMPLDRYYSKLLTGSFRDSFNTKYPIAAFYHLAKNGTTHDHLDAGQWEFEANGVKWAMDLGPDDYNLPNYFSNEGYQIYRKHSQGHNVVLINPLTDAGSYYGQNLKGEATLLSYQSTKKEASATFDMTDVYSRDVKSYTRGYCLGDNRTTFTVQDDITLSSSGSEIYWFMHTEANINIIDNKTALLTKNGHSLKVEISCSGANYEVLDMAAAPLEGTPKVSGQATETARKLAIHIPSSSGAEKISVKLIPVEQLPEDNPIIFTLSAESGSLNAKIYIPDTDKADINSARLFLVYYDSEENICKVETDEAEISDKKVNYLEGFDIPEGTKKVRAMLWDKMKTKVKPVVYTVK